MAKVAIVPNRTRVVQCWAAERFCGGLCQSQDHCTKQCKKKCKAYSVQQTVITYHVYASGKKKRINVQSPP